MEKTITESNYEYAGFWIRFGATLIDTIIVMIVTYPLLVTIYGWQYFGSANLIAGPADFFISLFFPALTMILCWSYFQGTPGKKVLNLRIVDADTGNSLSLTQSVGRYFSYFLSIIPLCLGLMWVGFDRKKQGWHDKLANSVVLREKRRGTESVSFPFS